MNRKRFIGIAVAAVFLMSAATAGRTQAGSDGCHSDC